MDVSSLGSLSNTPRAKIESNSDSVETNKASSTAQGKDSQEAQTSMIPPVQAPSDLGSEEGNVVVQENFSSANTKGSSTDSESRTQLDVLA